LPTPYVPAPVEEWRYGIYAKVRAEAWSWDIALRVRAGYDAGLTRDSENSMVLLGRIELPTSSLPMTRSTTELQQPAPKSRPYAKRGVQCQAACAAPPHLASRWACPMIAIRRQKQGPTVCARRFVPIYGGERRHLPLEQPDSLTKKDPPLRAGLNRKKNSAFLAPSPSGRTARIGLPCKILLHGIVMQTEYI
jgi:hypothetical protein